MTENDIDYDILIFVRFENGTTAYTSDFQVKIEGTLWPRELKALWEIIAIYKERNKQSNPEVQQIRKPLPRMAQLDTGRLDNAADMKKHRVIKN